MLDLSAFANPWEHARLLSDRRRNDVLVGCILRHAPGHRVLEVGTGTGVLACVAARAGARRVIAVEPTAQVQLAHALVMRNGLDAVVEVVEARIEDLEPRPVDFAFAELLNADPFYEGAVEAAHAAAAWVVPGGLLAPRRLSVHVALVRDGESAREIRMAREELTRLGTRFELDLGPVSDLFDGNESYRHTSHVSSLASTPARAFDVTLGEIDHPPDVTVVDVEIREAGPVGGAVVWFEAELDGETSLHNVPGREGHWGQLVCAFPEERGTRAGQRVALEVRVEDGELDVAFADA